MKTTIDDTLGLIHTVLGDGLEVGSSVANFSTGTVVTHSGAVHHASTLDGNLHSVRLAPAADTLKKSESGFVIIPGDGAAKTIQFPMNAGWNAKFILTGALSNAITLSSSAGSGGAIVTGSMVITAGDASSAGILTADGQQIKFHGSNSRPGDMIEITVLTDGLWHARGTSNI
jgi:hypothetical protein